MWQTARDEWFVNVASRSRAPYLLFSTSGQFPDFGRKPSNVTQAREHLLNLAGSFARSLKGKGEAMYLVFEKTKTTRMPVPDTDPK